MTTQDVISKIQNYLSVEEKEAELIVTKAINGNETDENNLGKWMEDRFMPNTVFIDEEGYARMCIDALKILGTTAATDYGSSRQRDLGQLWGDMTRGYLGELAFKLFLEKRNIKIELGHELGKLEDYLPSDIETIQKKNEKPRPPKIKIGIKATKWNGIWLDIPGDQFNHSDVHILIKVGTGRDHLFAYLKKISVFKEKVLKVGQDIGLLTSTEADKLYDKLPTFKPIPAYIAGFVRKDQEYKLLSYHGKKGRIRYMISGWNGPIAPGDLEKIKVKEKIPGQVQFEGIGSFNHDKGYLFNTGNLKWKSEEWTALLESF